MAKLHTALALAAAALSLILLLQTTCTSLKPNFLLSEWTAQISKDWYPFSVPLQHPLLSGGEDAYLLGLGKADITGPVVEINFMGYADPNQLGTGLRQRIYSRAFIIREQSDPSQSVVYLVLDTQSGDTAVRYGVLQGLRKLGPQYAQYGPHNVAVTGTHSHSGPGAWLNYLLPQITSRGFDNQTYQAIVSGVILSIQRAHESLTPGKLTLGAIEVNDTNVNRSPFAYLSNPREEREKYEHDVDKTLTMLRFQRLSDGKDMGVLSWFAVHGTSMLGNNTLVTGDNKGVASYLFERAASLDSQNYTSGFVAGFSQANVGDTSPNVRGAWCEDGSGKQCTFERSLCNGKNHDCHGRGPYFGLNDGGTRSCFEIGKRQFEAADQLLTNMRTQSHAETSINGPVASFHTFHNMSNHFFTDQKGRLVRTCSAALGYSFAAGTTDGPGAFDFKQNSSGKPDANPFWNVVRNSLHKPSEDQKDCQAPKPILLDVGETLSPYAWTPNLVDLQLLRIGQLVVIVSPGEATTMAGRRWRAAIEDAAKKWLTAKSRVVLGGPANTYTHYISTEEEYQVQRYEGASTLYGPHTLSAYIQLTTALVRHLQAGEKPPGSGPQPPINVERSLSFIRPVVFDSPGLFRSFGQVVSDVKSPNSHAYGPGDVASATFAGANPRNNLQLESSYAKVQKLRDDLSEFDTVKDDRDWELVFSWRRISTPLASSEATVSWEIAEGTEPGLYRLTYSGHSKGFGGGTITPFSGKSSVFEVI